MNEERRRLLLARDAWRSMHPTETEVLRAAKRLAAKFSPTRALSFGRRVRMVSGAMATIAGIAYAGSGGWAELSGWFERGQNARALSEEQAQSADGRRAGPREQAQSADGRRAGPRDPKEERVGVVPERLAVAPPTPAPADSAGKAKKKVARGAPLRARRAEGVVDGKDAIVSVDRVDSTWAEVNSALGTLDYQRAESLLLRLAASWQDADTRGKANLGLAQLAAARGDCERARVLALGVAAMSGIEMKTVRRALELAVRCAR